MISYGSVLNSMADTTAARTSGSSSAFLVEQHQGVSEHPMLPLEPVTKQVEPFGSVLASHAHVYRKLVGDGHARFFEERQGLFCGPPFGWV